MDDPFDERGIVSVFQPLSAAAFVDGVGKGESNSPADELIATRTLPKYGTERRKAIN